MRPLLLLDIDGVLSPTGRSVPHPHARHATDDHDVVIHPNHGAWLATLSATFDLVWATTWGERANAVYAPLLGLPPAPVMPLGALPREGTRKLAAVRTWGNGRSRGRTTSCMRTRGRGRRREACRRCWSARRRQSG